MPDHIEICPIQLPGRENRMKEPLIDNIQNIDILEKILMSENDKPFALYSHSS
jgi:surfactin synthase thioesterase subunit